MKKLETERAALRLERGNHAATEVGRLAEATEHDKARVENSALQSARIQKKFESAPLVARISGLEAAAATAAAAAAAAAAAEYNRRLASLSAEQKRALETAQKTRIR